MDDTKHNHWKTAVFNLISTFTKTLISCSALSMDSPDGLPLYGFPIICIVMAVIESPFVLVLTFNWSYKKLANAVTYVIEKLSVLILRCQLPTSDVV